VYSSAAKYVMNEHTDGNLLFYTGGQIRPLSNVGEWASLFSRCDFGRIYSLNRHSIMAYYYKKLITR